MILLAVEEEREKLFEGSTDTGKPRMRTPQEILTKYKFGGVINVTNVAQSVMVCRVWELNVDPLLQDAAAAAAHAKDKLMQRQEKLEVNSSISSQSSYCFLQRLFRAILVELCFALF
jgi:syntaxin-binding protein 5